LRYLRFLSAGSCEHRLSESHAANRKALFFDLVRASAFGHAIVGPPTACDGQ
jgi:hypothetical protein